MKPAGGRDIAGRTLASLGSLVLVASGALHCFGAYPGLSEALRASNLAPPLSSTLRAVFLLVGWDWFVFAAITLLVTWRTMQQGRLLVLLCGAAVLVQTAVTLRFIGFFVGNELIGSAALLLLAGGLLLPQEGRRPDR